MGAKATKDPARETSKAGMAQEDESNKRVSVLRMHCSHMQEEVLIPSWTVALHKLGTQECFWASRSKGWSAHFCLQKLGFKAGFPRSTGSKSQAQRQEGPLSAPSVASWGVLQRENALMC